MQHSTRRDLVGSGLLILLVLGLSLLAGPLQVDLQLPDLLLGLQDILFEALDFAIHLLVLSLEVSLLALSSGSEYFVVVQALYAVVVLLHLIRLLLAEDLQHIVDSLLDLGERIELDA